jgi:hypothetical protein
MIQAVIDRFEGDIAVCEKSDRTMFNIPRNKLPSDAREGDVINIDKDVIEVDLKATADLKASARKLMGDLLRKDKP